MNRTVFVNRILNMKKISTIGLDMDHTLLRYHTAQFEALVFQLVIEELITNSHYPETIRAFTFHAEDAIRGLVIDSKHGNILKLSRYGAIRQSAHGTHTISHADQKKIYRSIYVDLGDPNYMAIDTAFSLSFCVLYSHLIDLKDAHPNELPNYATIALDVLHCVDKVHADGRLKTQICQQLDRFVIKDPELVAGIKRFIQQGKTFFLLTNSDYYYTKILLDYAINPFLTEGETWETLFQYTVTLANKPRFFYDQLRFLKIDPSTGVMSNLLGPITPGIYQGGNAKQFTDDLSLNGDEILYIGDHIYGDILRLKKDCNWRTALVVEELGSEIAAQKKALPIERDIGIAMAAKMSLEEALMRLYIHKADTPPPEGPSASHLQTQISTLDQTILSLLHKQHVFYNPRWDRIFRAGAEESYFAYQVERYACIYMEKLSDLFDHSPITYFRAKRRLLPHDLEG